MNLQKKSPIKAAGTVAGVSALAGITSYMTTRFLIRTALDREAPKAMEKMGSRISGTMQDEELFNMRKEAAKKLSEAETESVNIVSHDGINLEGHWYPCDKPERIVIAMHGWRSSWCNDFGLVAEFLHESNCSVLFAEQRGQNSSEGEYIGFGVTEQFDCLDWIQWAIKNKSSQLPIYLCGVSMGATTVLMAAGLELPQNVHGIMADCGFTSPDAIWKHIANNNLHISYHLRRLIAKNIFNKRNQISGFDYSTVEALQNSKTPVLLIHGAEDHFVPVEMTYENYSACVSPKWLMVVPGAGHGMSYLVDPESYQNIVRLFWKEFDNV